jgi:hypothetical protein
LCVVRTWKQLRVTVCGFALSLFNAGPKASKVSLHALTMVAAMKWLVDSLQMRPDDGSACRNLMACIFPTTTNLQHPDALVRRADMRGIGDDYPCVPYCSTGAYFLRAIIWPPTAAVPRFYIYESPQIPSDTFKYIFQASIRDVVNAICPTGFADQTAPKHRHPQVKGTTHKRSDPEPEQPIFNVEVVLPEAAVDVGPDVDLEGHREEGQDGDDPAVLLTGIWLQFLSDIMQKLANPRGKRNLPSYCRLAPDVKQNVPTELLASPNLACCFRAVQVRRPGKVDWDKAFQVLWPPRGYEVPAGVKHYHNVRYLKDWYGLIGSLDGGAVNALRKAVKGKFDELTWIPAATTQHIWCYKADRRFTSFKDPIAGFPTGPKVLWNPSPARQSFVWAPQVQAEEEEEGTEEEG